MEKYCRMKKSTFYKYIGHKKLYEMNLYALI